MIWVVGGFIALGVSFAILSIIMVNGRKPDIRSTGPFYMLAGIVLFSVGVVLAIGNAAVQALL